MRLHELTVSAFGPFVDEVEVDFDELSTGGLFLLTGDTGAGKTSVLDAVCFALYGEVPGDRHSARHLRSDQADPLDAPRVVLRLSIGARTFRFTRSPAWDRPKRRGTGTTRVQAHVVIEEERAGRWVTLTTRLDEAGHLVADLLGMTCTQFTQVAMLPQGRFQAFLRATSAERHSVLQRLFRTRRFEEVEHWLVERRSELRRRSQICHDRSAGVLNRIQEAAGVAVPEEWDVRDLDAVVSDGSLLRWVEAILRDATTEAAARERALIATTAQLEAHRKADERGRELAEAGARGAKARHTLAGLDETAAQETALADAIDAHQRASSVLPSALRAENAVAVAEAAEASAAHHLAAVSSVLAIPHDLVRPDVLAEAATRISAARAVAETWLPREARLHDERARLRLLGARLARLQSRITAGEEEQSQLAEAHERLAPLLLETRGLAAADDARRLAVTLAESGLASARHVVDLQARLREARRVLEETTLIALDLRERHLDLREQRISGMAAELATGLAVGCSCPVCGSAEHPAPAAGSRGVSRADEDAARQRHETADFERQTVKESVTGLEAQLTGALTRSQGHKVSYWERAHFESSHALAQSTAAQARLATLETELDTVRLREQQLTSVLASSRATLVELAQHLADGEQRCELSAAELRELLSAHPGTDSAAELVELHSQHVGILDGAREALTARDRAARELTEATSAAEDAAISAGFSSLPLALSAVLPGCEAASRAASLEVRRSSRAVADAVLVEPAVVAASSEPLPDLVALRAALRDSEALHTRCHADQLQSSSRTGRLRTLGAELDREVAEWEPVRREHAVTADLAALVEGRSADNQLKMRLSAYVLSERLRQVVAAANERLGDITDQRYLLEQADEKGAGEQRGGLSLRVRDEWSGKLRDPATLSGGETFLVSLALALGLADTVSNEAGGTQLDTLFIDEGFGALDASTLDGVMNTLDSLRDGGRVVGLVSHVAELRSRVPMQLEVRRARRGSTVGVSVARCS